MENTNLAKQNGGEWMNFLYRNVSDAKTSHFPSMFS